MERIYSKSELVEMWRRPLDIQYQVAISKMLEAIEYMNEYCGTKVVIPK